MSFMFSFDMEDTEDSAESALCMLTGESEIAYRSKNTVGVPCREVLDNLIVGCRTNSYKTHHFNGIVYRQPTHLDRCTASSSSSLKCQNIDAESDLIPGHYEGGYKIWECSLDLASIVSELPSALFQLPRKVLELGCGHGVPGIVTLKAFEDTIEEIVFTDFNREVLQETTWPSIKLNLNDDALNKVRCIAGDWSSLSSLVDKFDLILSAETLYTRESCLKVTYMTMDFITACLLV